MFGGPAWERVPDGEWYLHLFAVEQPDLDWSNPEVRAEFESVIRFWLDRGIDGFRIDVAHGLTKDPALPDLGDQLEIDGRDRGKRRSHPHWDRDELHDVYRAWRAIVDQYAHDPMFVAEAWVSTPERLARFVRSDELHTAFNFDLLEATWDAAKLRKAIDSSNAADRSVGAPSTWVLENHDVQRVVTRYGGGAAGTRRARAGLLLILALPGNAYLYQGQELALEEVLDLPAKRPRGPGVHPERRRATRQGRLSGTHPVDATGSLAGLRSRRRAGCRNPVPGRAGRSRRRTGIPSPCWSSCGPRCASVVRSRHWATGRCAG